MAIYGNNAGDGYALRGVSGANAKGLPITISNSGETGASIHVRTDGTASGCQLAVAVYDGSGNLIDSGSATVGASSDGDYISANLSGEPLPAGNYVIFARVDEADVFAYFSDLASAGRQCETNATFPGWDDPATINTDSRAYDIYLTTNEPASGATLTTPTATSITQTTATIGCTTDSATGTLYGVVTTSATAPSAAQIAAGQDHTGSAAVFAGSNASLTADTNNTIAATGLTAGTAYHTHFVQDTGGATYSNVLSGSFSTLATNAGFRISNIQSPTGSPIGNVDPVSVAIWNNAAAAHGAAADTVITDAAISGSVLEVANGTVGQSKLVAVRYSTGEGYIRTFSVVADIIDLDAV